MQNIEKVKYLYYVKCMRFLQSCEYTIFYALWEIWKKSKTSNASKSWLEKHIHQKIWWYGVFKWDVSKKIIALDNWDYFADVFCLIVHIVKKVHNKYSLM